jgi:anti-sigma regulatory factor (Ser/Thr protein kinase)
MPSQSRKSNSRGPRARDAAAGRDHTVRFRMPSRRDAVSPTVERILKAVTPAGLSRDQRDDLAVALAEALSNAAVHGNRLRPDSHVSVVIKVKPGVGAVVDVRDSGHGFDVEGLSDPTHPEKILTPGGRGVFLMRRLVDHVEYTAPGNHVRLTIGKRRSRAR